MTLGALGVAGLVEWPLLLAVGGGALLLRRLSNSHNDGCARRIGHTGEGGYCQVDQFGPAAQDAGQAGCGAAVRRNTITHPPLIFCE